MDIFVIGSKGIPANYGGFETFVENLTMKKSDIKINYHISCLGDKKNEFYYNGARCFTIKVPNIGSARAILYDILSLKECINYIKKNNIQNAVVYILACRIGPFFKYYKNKLIKLGVKVVVNPDGHEWKRSKWNHLVKKYWKSSEKSMVKYSDLLVCDSRGIEEYIQEEYKRFSPKTTYIAYGADINGREVSKETNILLDNWYKEYKVTNKNYYLIVGRFVPENNYQLMIKEFKESDSKKDLVIISNVEHNKYFQQLVETTNFENDTRIKFVGTVYNQDLLYLIRKNAFGYLHGHEVGGTNPSLLEALAYTELNLLLDVNFNKEVAENAALYFKKANGSLAQLINQADNLKEIEIKRLERLAKSRINNNFSWEKIVSDYEELFLNKL